MEQQLTGVEVRLLQSRHLRCLRSARLEVTGHESTWVAGRHCGHRMSWTSDTHCLSTNCSPQLEFGFFSLEYRLHPLVDAVDPLLTHSSRILDPADLLVLLIKRISGLESWCAVRGRVCGLKI